MSGDFALTDASWRGTQMKPDIFEPVTAEWAGRLATNAGYLFSHQQQVIFAEGLHDKLITNAANPAAFTQVLSRKFWLNEVYGTLALLFNLANYNLTSAVISGTVQSVLGGGGEVVGTCDGTYTSGGWKSLTIHTGPDWHHTDTSYYGWLTLRAYITAGDLSNAWIMTNYLSLSGLPRT